MQWLKVQGIRRQTPMFLEPVTEDLCPATSVFPRRIGLMMQLIVPSDSPGVLRQKKTQNQNLSSLLNMHRH